MRPQQEDGFSLVELIAVVTVLGILMAIALPTLAAAGDRAGTRAAEVDLHNAASAALLLASEAGGTFVVDGSPISAADLHEAEPSLRFAAAASGDVIGVDVEDGETTLHLSKYDRGGELVELIIDAGRNLVTRVIDGEAEATSSPTTGTTTGSGDGGSSGEHRRDGDTPAAGRRSRNGG